MTHTSKPVRGKLPCPDQEYCKSSDAYTEYDDGHGFCFSCSKSYEINKKINHLTNADRSDTLSLSNTIAIPYTYQYFSWRGIDKDSFKAYEAKAKVDPEGKPIAILFPYSSTAAKERMIEIKEFKWSGEANKASLFGMDKFSAGEAKAITITEGELDALSAYQMLGSKYPVVSVRSSSSARSDCEKAYDYLNAFEKIYLCFDNDEPGQKAVKEVSQ